MHSMCEGLTGGLFLEKANKAEKRLLALVGKYDRARAVIPMHKKHVAEQRYSYASSLSACM